jgi:hypothetical protein
MYFSPQDGILRVSMTAEKIKILWADIKTKQNIYFVKHNYLIFY